MLFGLLQTKGLNCSNRQGFFHRGPRGCWWLAMTKFKVKFQNQNQSTDCRLFPNWSVTAVTSSKQKSTLKKKRKKMHSEPLSGHERRRETCWPQLLSGHVIISNKWVGTEVQTSQKQGYGISFHIEREREREIRLHEMALSRKAREGRAAGHQCHWEGGLWWEQQVGMRPLAGLGSCKWVRVSSQHLSTDDTPYTGVCFCAWQQAGSPYNTSPQHQHL